MLVLPKLSYMSSEFNLRATLLGTGVAIPWDDRAQSSILVETPGTRLLLDCGAGALLRLGEADVDPTSIHAVVLTHLHSDHVNDFLPLVKARWLLDHPEMRLYGPPGTQEWYDGLLQAYPYMTEKADVRISEVSPGETFKVGGARLRAVATEHSVPSQGYSVSANDRRVVYSGDTEPVSAIRDAADGADLLIHECSFPDGMTVTNHTTPSWLGEALSGVEVGEIVLTHLYPHVQEHLDHLADNVRWDVGVPVFVGEDMEVYEL